MGLPFRRSWKFIILVMIVVVSFTMFCNTFHEDKEVMAKVPGRRPAKIRTNRIKSPTKNTTVNPRSHFQKIVYIKISKTGSTTLHTIFDSYGYTHRLPLLIPKTDGEGFNPRELDPGKSWDVAPDRKLSPVISAAHGRYHKTFFDKYFSNNTAYVTSIRHPVSWFISHIDFKNRKSHKFTAKDVLSSDKMFYSRSSSVYQLDREYHNYFLDWLGFSLPNNYVYNETEILHYINLIDKKFHLVMLMEYFPESLLLLKNVLGWSMKDIFYTHLNPAPYRSGVHLSSQEKATLVDENHNRGDWLLYQHFNRTFWKKVEQMPDFYDELEVFKQLNKQVVDFCHSLGSADNKLRKLHLHTKWESLIIIDEERCLSLTNKLYPIIHRKYAPFFGSVSVEDLHLERYRVVLERFRYHRRNRDSYFRNRLFF